MWRSKPCQTMPSSLQQTYKPITSWKRVTGHQKKIRMVILTSLHPSPPMPLLTRILWQLLTLLINLKWRRQKARIPPRTRKPCSMQSTRILCFSTQLTSRVTCQWLASPHSTLPWDLKTRRLRKMKSAKLKRRRRKRIKRRKRGRTVFLERQTSPWT